MPCSPSPKFSMSRLATLRASKNLARCASQPSHVTNKKTEVQIIIITCSLFWNMGNEAISKPTLCISVHIQQLLVSHLQTESPALLQLRSLRPVRSICSRRECLPPGSTVNEEKEELKEGILPTKYQGIDFAAQTSASANFHPCYPPMLCGQLSQCRQKWERTYLSCILRELLVNKICK